VWEQGEKTSRAALSSKKWHHRVARYASIHGDGGHGHSLLPIDQLLGVIQESVLPSAERLIELKAQRKVVTGGYPVGRKAIVFIMEANSEKELYEILESLPLTEVAEARVTPLKDFEELRGVD
jgi:hypothetical protein